MFKNYSPINYCLEDFTDLHQIENDIPAEVWKKIVSTLDEHTRQERFALIDRIHEVIEVLLDEEGIILPH